MAKKTNATEALRTLVAELELKLTASASNVRQLERDLAFEKRVREKCEGEAEGLKKAIETMIITLRP